MQVVFLALVVSNTSALDSDRPLLAFALELVAEGLEQPVQVIDPGDGSGRLVAVEQTGRLRIIQDGRVDHAPYLDLSEIISCCGERGLLGAAFHPDYSANGFLFVDYTDANGDTVVARYRVSQDSPNRIDESTAQTVLTVEQPAGNHNGGMLLFGPNDGYLYIGLGDGGGGNSQNGQDLGTLLGKILRIDVDASDNGAPYAIPLDNPFVDQPGARPEIWAYGLRNPWRFSVDRATGDIWIGDVGSATYEEVNLLPASGPSGANFGWPAMEGEECRQDAPCDSFVAPASGFDRDEGCVVTGGYVYRGKAIPELDGVYVFADYCSGKVWGLAQDDAGPWTRLGPVETGLRISSFGEDGKGELFVVDLQGSVYRLLPARSDRCEADVAVLWCDLSRE
jgi:glucose/arabinose dehydrogenase